MTKQTDINEKMRAILIDWLVEVHLKFKLMVETLYLTVNLIDRYLEKESITRNKLQLVGVTAMFLASKYEEIYAPECRDFVYISDKAYTREQILAMEGLMLSKLNFQLTTPNALVFLKRFAKVAGIATTPRSTTELLVVAPDPLVPFANSAYAGTQRYDLQPGASLVAVDWVASGRAICGERASA